MLVPFAGFGTTLDVCAEMGRRAVGVELLADRAAVARERAGDYRTYLHELTEVFVSVRSFLPPGGHLVINAADIRTPDGVTPWARDITRSLRRHMSFRSETRLVWDVHPATIEDDSCLVFQR